MADLKQAIRQLEDRRFRAMVEADAAALEEPLADSMVYTHSSVKGAKGWQMTAWQSTPIP